MKYGYKYLPFEQKKQFETIIVILGLIYKFIKKHFMNPLDAWTRDLN